MRRTVFTATVVTTLVIVGGGVGLRTVAAGSDEAKPRVTATWTSQDPAPDQGVVSGEIAFPADTTEVALTLHHATPTSVPDACESSDITTARSYLTDDGLVCQPRAGATSLTFEAVVRGTARSHVRGTVTVDGEEAATLPDRPIEGGARRPASRFRLISSPDFTNADIGDLSRGPNAWNPLRSTNSINANYADALSTVLDDWASLHPVGVLIAGDLVCGRWGYDDHHTGNFGPVGTLRQGRAAIRRAARTYYPQFRQRFAQRSLPLFPAIGDHELGDDPWTPRKVRYVRTYRAEYARQFTAPGRDAHLADHPRGPAAHTAYAGRPRPDLEIITLDMFDLRPGHKHLRLDPQQMRWLRGVLQRAHRDRVRWIVVQGHLPILEPVRYRHSSNLSYEGGGRSRLWRLFERYDVDLYLDGEVHDVTTRTQGGVVQVSHGGAFKFGLVNALVLDVQHDRLSLALRDYDVRFGFSLERRLWETRRDGMDPSLRIVGRPTTIGTATITDGGGLTQSSGALEPLG